MESIEYRYIQGIKTLRAVIQLTATKKYWNDKTNMFQDEITDDCYLPLVELSFDNVYNSNIDSFDFMKLYKDVVEEGLYVTASANLRIAPAALYSILIFDGETLISKTQKQKGSSKTFLEMIREVQIRLGFPESKRLIEPNARKLGSMMNDAIRIILSSGKSRLDCKVLFSTLVKEGSNEILVNPANCDNLNGLGKVFLDGTEISQAQAVHANSFINYAKGNPNVYIITSKTNYNLGLTFNSFLTEDKYFDIEVYEHPKKLKFAGDRTILDSDLIIKGTEFLAKDDAGMGGDVSGREMFYRYLNTDANLNDDINWSEMSV